jgi:uncharacterized protein
MIELLVLQPTSFCNLDCAYCYVPDRSNKARMARATLERLAELLRAEPERTGEQIEVLWHAGEPLAAGLPFYEEASAILSRISPSTRILHTFQTNATLIDGDWCDFFKRVGAQVGVSLDGPQSIHDTMRKTRVGQGSHAATMRGVARMQAAGLDVSALAVVTRESLGRAREIFEFFVEAGIVAVGFNVEEVEGENAHSSLQRESGFLEQRYRAFMAEFLHLNLARGAPLSIREVQATVQALANRRRKPGFVPTPAETEVGRILTISRDGEVFTFSPELASGYPDRPNAFAIGNIHEARSLNEIVEGLFARKMQGEVDSGVHACRDACDYFAVCGGGSPANKIYEQGSFSATETIKCRLQVKVMTDLLLDLARQPRRHLRTQTAPAT